MNNPTYQELREKVERDLDLQEETFITPEELMGYCNEAIREAEAEIHNIYEDYFLVKAFVPLTAGQADIVLKNIAPDLYANKIRDFIYADGTKIYKIRRVKSSKKFEERAVINLYGTADYYRYIFRNDASLGPVIELTPPSKETSSDHVTVWYIREAKEVTQDSDEIDIPEFKNFIMAYMKFKCWSKEMAGSPPENVAQELQAQRELMVGTLTNMIADDDSEIEKDLSIYEDFV